MAEQANLIQLNASGKIDVQASVNVAEEYYGHVSSALNAGLNGGQGIHNALESLGWSVDFSGVTSVGGWVLQNMPLPSIVSRVAAVSLSIATTAEEGAAIGASVLAFTGVGAPLGAAAGAIVGAFVSLKSLFGHSQDAFVPGTFDYAQTLIPLPNPEDQITKAQVDRIVATWDKRVTGDLVDAFHGDKASAVKVAQAYWHFFDVLNLPTAEQERMAKAQADKNGGAEDQGWGTLDRAAAQAAYYAVFSDPRTGQKWTDLDWLNYLLAYRRGWERIVLAQEGAHPLLGGHYTPHNDYAAYLIAKFSSAKMPNAVQSAAAAKNARAQLPPAVASSLLAAMGGNPPPQSSDVPPVARAVLQGSQKPKKGPAPGSLDFFLLYYLG